MKNTNSSISKISVVLPCHNEEENIPLIYSEIQKLNLNLDIIFVDDGSHDSTWLEIEKLCSNENVRGIRLSRNFGHQSALDAGLSNVESEAVIVMDSDLQHPVDLIPELISKWEEGYKIVNTERVSTEKVGFFKNMLSKLFYKIFNQVTEIELTPGSSDFRLMDKEVIDFLKNIPTNSKFFRGLIPWTGFKMHVVKFEANERIHGQSSYSLNKMFELARIGFTYFSYLPLKLILILGALITLSSTILFICTIIFKLLNSDLFSSAALFGSFILANTGVIIIILGIIAVYQINVYKEVKGLPPYIIKDKLNI